MKKGILAAAGAAFLFSAALASFAEGKSASTGKELFEKHCAVCHPNGGNTIRPEKTLHRKDLAENNAATVKDIVKRMRNPGPGMTRFDKAAIPDTEAKKIAEYVLKTFQ
ncbi:MAG: c-type cytochrome [Thermodesulfovibrionales bacterium]